MIEYYPYEVEHFGEHDDDMRLLLPDGAPEVSDGMFVGTCAEKKKKVNMHAYVTLYYTHSHSTLARVYRMSEK